MNHAAGADLCVMTHARDPDRPRRALDGLYLCRGHVEDLRRLVAELPARAADLDRPAAGASRGTGNGGGIAIDEDAARHRSHMQGVLASWCRVVAEDRGIGTPASAELHHTAPWMLPHIEWCAGHRWVDEMLSELREVTGRALALADIPARRLELGERCLVHTGGERCTGGITLVIRGDDWHARCDECEEPQEATRYLRGARGGRWITADGVITLARLFGLPCGPDVVRQWHHRRRIAGKRIGDATWYDLGSVQSYLSRRQQRARITGATRAA